MATEDEPKKKLNFFHCEKEIHPPFSSMAKANKKKQFFLMLMNKYKSLSIWIYFYSFAALNEKVDVNTPAATTMKMKNMTEIEVRQMECIPKSKTK